MSTIILKTKINAPVERCFYLATSIDLHKISASNSNEQAIEGVTEGLIRFNETVTWKAKHFGVWHRMKVKITKYEMPNYFVDEMVEGTFKAMKHRHQFIQSDNETMMIDTFEFSSPLGILGKIIDKLILKNYLTKFLLERNSVIKEFAESEKWRQLF